MEEEEYRDCRRKKRHIETKGMKKRHTRPGVGRRV